ncbi:hypothetical protein APC65_14880 [Acinetobacter baumannii]|nr:hypothetical protein APC65_14880 [Acinetobacter baumannii]
MSGLKNNTNCSSKGCGCSSKEVLELLSKIVEQNTTLIQQVAQKDQIILAAIEQNNELLMQLTEQEEQPVIQNRTLD